MRATTAPATTPTAKILQNFTVFIGSKLLLCRWSQSALQRLPSFRNGGDFLSRFGVIISKLLIHCLQDYPQVDTSMDRVCDCVAAAAAARLVAAAGRAGCRCSGGCAGLSLVGAAARGWRNKSEGCVPRYFCGRA